MNRTWEPRLANQRRPHALGSHLGGHEVHFYREQAVDAERLLGSLHREVLSAID